MTLTANEWYLKWWNVTLKRDSDPLLKYAPGADDRDALENLHAPIPPSSPTGTLNRED